MTLADDPFAFGRHSGLALIGPARLVFLLPLFALLLTACRQPPSEHFLQGAALGTGYHITLYADLDAPQSTTLKAAIQDDLAALERQRNQLEWLDSVAFGLFGLVLPKPSRQGIDRWLQVVAVDRLTQRLAMHDAIQAVLVEVGGVLRGHGVPPGGAWHLSLDTVGLPTLETARQVQLQDGALVHRFVNPAVAPPASLTSLLAVSVIAADASSAHYQAELLVNAGPGRALELANEMDSAARIVVKTVTGIEIHYSRAIEPWFESSL